MPRKQIIASAFRSLVRDIADEDPDEVNSWVRKATKRINEDLRVGEMLKHKVLPLTSNVFSAPEGYLHHSDVRLGTNPTNDIIVGKSQGALIYCTPAQISTWSACHHLAGREPGYFTTHGNQFEIVPWAIASGVRQISMWYFAKIPNLAETDDATNWLLEDCEDLFLNAILIFGHRRYYEDDRALLKDGLVSQEIDKLNTKYREAKHGDGPLVQQPARKLGGRFS